MARAKICEQCGSLNNAESTRCSRCGSRFPSAVEQLLLGAFEAVLGREYPMTRLIVGLCLFVFAFLAFGDGEIELLGAGRLSTALRWGALMPALAYVEPFRLLSAMFVHFGLLHIGFNLTALVDLGKWAERTIGSARFVVIFTATGVAGFIVSCLWYRDTPFVPTAGASGGIFGLVGALVGYLFARRDPAWKQVATRVGIYTLLFSFLLPVNNAAHLGGCVVGLVSGYWTYRERRPYRAERIFRWLAGACVVAFFTSIVLSHLSGIWKEQRKLEERAERSRISLEQS